MKTAALLPLLALAAQAAPKPVPRMQAVPQPHDQVSFQREGVEIARYHYGTTLRRPFVFPLIGPSGRPLTRMGHPRDPQSHSHHNSMWIAHQSVGGVNFWEDHGPGRIAHVRTLRMDDGEDAAFLEVENAWLDADARPVLREYRRLRVRTLQAGEWVLELDLQFETPGAAEVLLGQTAFGFAAVRMAKTIGVHDGGGTIRNSEGGVDEAGCFRKPARWCDYAGPVTTTASEGVALFDHPQNLGHPAPFHVRDDGWMGAAATCPGAHTLTPGRPLRLRYAVFIHADVALPEKIETQWQAWAATSFEDFPLKKR
jgi:hypothetical protein